MAGASDSASAWLGSSMQEIYKANGPWSYDVQTIVPSKYHAVLYEVPANGNSPPKAHVPSQTKHWDVDHVKMPYSPKNLYPIKDENDEYVIKSRWELIQTALLQPIRSSRELQSLMITYNKRLTKMQALHYLFDKVLDEGETANFFQSVLPGIVQLALQLPEIVPGNLPLLKQNHCRSISLSQWQIASLLANAFLCTFQWKENSENLVPGANFSRLFDAHWRPKRKKCVAQKLKAIIHYFKRVLAKPPAGVVTFERKFIHRSDLPNWEQVDDVLADSKLHITSTGVIEHAQGLLQVDFANKNVGGGVLAFGCVQEEIRFVICPELIISRLFTEQLGAHEALVITGIERYSDYTGYSDAFVWAGDHVDPTPFDACGRRRTSIVAIDAIRFAKPLLQYDPALIRREIDKAYVGFHSRLAGSLPAVATGNWGCGAYKGNPLLKSLLQWMACRVMRRDMVYYTFGDTDLRDKIYQMYQFISSHQLTIAQLWSYLCTFAQSKIDPDNLPVHIRDAHFGVRTQPTITTFFAQNQRKRTKEGRGPARKEKPSKMEVDSQGLTLEEFFDVDVLFGQEQDEDIIESSQPACSHEDIADVMDQMEGGVDKSGRDVQHESLLSSVDEVNETLGSVVKKKEGPSSSVKNVQSDCGRKTKISDYFPKIDKE